MSAIETTLSYLTVWESFYLFHKGQNMKVKFNESLTGAHGTFRKDEIADLPPDVANEYVDCLFATYEEDLDEDEDEQNEDDNQIVYVKPVKTKMKKKKADTI